MEEFPDLGVELAVGTTGAFEEGWALWERLFQDKLEQTFYLTISFGGHEWSAKLVCRKSGAGGGIGHGDGAKAELGTHGGAVERCGG